MVTPRLLRVHARQRVTGNCSCKHRSWREQRRALTSQLTVSQSELKFAKLHVLGSPRIWRSTGQFLSRFNTTGTMHYIKLGLLAMDALDVSFHEIVRIMQTPRR